MFAVEIYAAVRKFVFIEGHSQREAARVFGLSRDTIAKMCRYSAPPGYVRTKAPERPKLGPLVPVIDAILDADKMAPPKQRHTAKRIFERLRAEHGFAGGYTVVKDYVCLARTRSREVFVPLAHPPGHAQVDFGECIGVIGGVRMKLHVFCFDLPHSDACFIKAYAAETTEAFLDGHVSAFAFFDGVPRSFLYDNLEIAVARDEKSLNPPPSLTSTPKPAKSPRHSPRKFSPPTSKGARSGPFACRRSRPNWPGFTPPLSAWNCSAVDIRAQCALFFRQKRQPEAHPIVRQAERNVSLTLSPYSDWRTTQTAIN